MLEVSPRAAAKGSCFCPCDRADTFPGQAKQVFGRGVSGNDAWSGEGSAAMIHGQGRGQWQRCMVRGVGVRGNDAWSGEGGQWQR